MENSDKGIESAKNNTRKRRRRTRESGVARWIRNRRERFFSFLRENFWSSNNYSSYALGSGERLLESTLGDTAAVPPMPASDQLANPANWFRWGAQFLRLWVVSRPFMGLLLAVPGITVYVAFFSMLNASRAVSARKLTDSYHHRFIDAAKREDFQTATLIGDALIRLNPNNSAAVYNAGVLEQQAGNDRAAEVLMRDAAINLRSGQAALWLAGHDGNQQDMEQWSPEKRNLHRKWLAMAIKDSPNSLAARVALSNLHRANGDTFAAYAVLVSMAGQDSSVDQVLVMLEKELGRIESAKKRATDLIQTNLSVLTDVPELLELRIRTAALLVFVDKEDEAEKLLAQGKNYLIGQAEEELFARAMAESYVLMANKTAQADTSPSGLMKRLNYLLRAIELDPEGSNVTSAVLEACVEASGSGNDQALVLKEAIVRGISPEAAHFVLGTIALFEGKTNEALDHLEIAIEKSPNVPGILNNLAYALSQREDADLLPRALQLANAAVETSGGNLYVLETRGQIYLKMGRWKEAISDLESALAESELRSQVRTALALAYDELGRPELAARHRELQSKGL